MKLKNIIGSLKARKGIGVMMSSVILSSSCFVCTSCEDMFTAENHLVTTDLAPQDTVFHTMGIVKRMQKLRQSLQRIILRQHRDQHLITRS